MKSDLAKQQCKPCECGTPPLKGEVLRQMQNRLTYGEVGIQISTLSVGGLTENDFILAAKINALD